MLEIPLTADPSQVFSIIVNNERFDLRVILNSRSGIWTMDISKDGQDLINGIALLPGVNIMNPYNIAIKNMYIVNLENPSADPTKTGLGTNSKLFLLTDGEVTIG